MNNQIPTEPQDPGQSAHITVLFFARARDLAGCARANVPVTIGPSATLTAAEVQEAIGQAFPALAPVLSKLFLAVNDDFCTGESRIKVGDVVTCFPPVSGG